MGTYFRLEQRFGHLGISGLVRILAFFKVITWLIFLAEPGFGNKLLLDFQYVFQGEVWRLVSFMLIPGAVNPLILLIEVMFLLMIGEGLEQAWGAFGVTAYIFGSALEFGPTQRSPGVQISAPSCSRCPLRPIKRRAMLGATDYNSPVDLTKACRGRFCPL